MGNDLRGQYALIQLCPLPERMEYLNVGLVLHVPEIDFFKVKFVDEPKRVERLFGKQSRPFFDFVVQATTHNLNRIAGTSDLVEAFEEFSDRRANQLRLTSLLEIRISDDPELAFEKLFERLVARQHSKTKNVRARTRLKKIFRDFGVERILDKPKRVDIDEFDIEVSAPYAYQNGFYNYVDSIQITGNQAHDLREVGKKSIEGHLLAQHSALTRPARLVIIADFADHSERFFRAVDEHLRFSEVKLYRYDHVDILVDDIVKHADHRLT